MSQNARSARIVVAARDAPAMGRAVGCLEAAGVEINTVSSAAELTRALARGRVDAILLDSSMDAAKIAAEVQSLFPGLRIIMLADTGEAGWIDALRMLVSSTANESEHATTVENAAQRLARKLAQAERIEALGQMASGIAHDFNNTLMAALPWADLLRRKYPDDGVIQRAAEQIRGAVRRAADVTRQLLDFAQPRRPEVRKFMLPEFVERQAALLKKTLPSNVELTLEAGPSIEVEADPAQLGQVLLSLILNARDAMAEGGRVIVQTSLLHKEGAADLGIPAGDWAMATVSDTGHGIDPEDVERVFDPYFTTKDPGMGGGLGLSVAQRIMERHGGHIRIASRKGEGTQVRLVLPVVARAAKPNSGIAAEEPEGRLSGLRILVIDDDTDVAAGLEALLTMEGAVIETRDRGRSALALLDEGYLPDLVILDLGLPEMSGEEVYYEIRARHPSLPILVATGWGDRERTEFLDGDPRSAFQSKPFVIEALVDAISDLNS